MGVSVVEVAAPTDAVVAAAARLLRQLSHSAPPLEAADVARIVDHDATTLLVATSDDGDIVGMLTLAVFPIPSGVRAWIEDVVVDEAANNQGIATAMNREAIRIATEAGARTIDLTSNPRREAANHVYQKLGFKRRETNIYRYEEG